VGVSERARSLKLAAMVCLYNTSLSRDFVYVKEVGLRAMSLTLAAMFVYI